MQHEALERLAALAGVSAHELADLSTRMVAESVPRGVLVFRRGDQSDGMYLVLEGQVAFEIDGVMIGLCGPGEWFGEIALFTTGPRTADARVTVDATLVRVDRTGWTELAMRSPPLLASLCERLSRQLRAAGTRQRPSRAVVACADAAAWLPGLLASLHRQRRCRRVQVIDAGGSKLEHALAGLVAPDLLVLATAADAERLADRCVARVGPSAWTLTPGYGGRPVDRVEGRDVEEALARVARRLAGGTIGLALGAGGAYGFAHIGLVEALEAAGIPVDYVAGTSMGAIVGACVASGIDGPRMRAFAESVGARYRSIVLRDVDLRGHSLLTGRAVMAVLAELQELRSATFEALPTPFVAVATDIGTGAEVVLDSGPLLAGIQPSFAMPGIFAPCVRDGRQLIDGAMVNPVPVDRVRALGADVVIALQPIPPLRLQAGDPMSGLLGLARRLTSLLPLGGLRHSIETLDVSIRAFQTLWRELAIARAAAADVIVAPDLQRFFFLQFGAAGEIIEEGRRAAEEVVGALRERVGIGFTTAA